MIRREIIGRVGCALGLLTLIALPGSRPTRGEENVRGISIEVLGTLWANRGSVVIQKRMAVVSEELAKAWDEKSKSFVVKPEAEEEHDWHGQEFRVTRYRWNGTNYEEASKQLAFAEAVPAGDLGTDCCDRLNEKSVHLGGDLSLVLPVGSLAKKVVTTGVGEDVLTIIAFTTRSPSENTDDYSLFIAAIDNSKGRLLGLKELDKSVAFCGLALEDVTGDGQPEVIVDALSVGGSGYAKGVYVLMLAQPR